LGNPQDNIKSIHVAGTNGKGSVAVNIAAILGAAGYSVGLTTSPHLERINERIVINGVPVDDEALDDFALVIKQAARSVGRELSLFEAITATAFLAFYEVGLDFIVIETGLGGRLDATNVIRAPEACVITSISLDHTSILGESEFEIAREKGGIIKSGSPLYLGRMSYGVRELLRRLAEDKKSPCYCSGTEFSCEVTQESRDQFIGELIWGKSERITFRPALRGEHQVHNSALAAAVCKGIGVDSSPICRGIAGVFWPGRLEMLDIRGTEVLMECAHNPAGVDALTNYLIASKRKSLVVGFGVLNTKDWREMVRALLPFCREWNLLRPDSDCAVPCEDIRTYLSGFRINATSWEDDAHGFLINKFEKLNEFADSPTILLTGSIYLVGKLRKLLVPVQKPLWERDASAKAFNL